jgi:hypothetical protein
MEEEDADEEVDKEKEEDKEDADEEVDKEKEEQEGMEEEAAEEEKEEEEDDDDESEEEDEAEEEDEDDEDEEDEEDEEDDEVADDSRIGQSWASHLGPCRVEPLRYRLCHEGLQLPNLDEPFSKDLPLPPGEHAARSVLQSDERHTVTLLDLDSKRAIPIMLWGPLGSVDTLCPQLELDDQGRPTTESICSVFGVGADSFASVTASFRQVAKSPPAKWMGPLTRLAADLMQLRLFFYGTPTVSMYCDPRTNVWSQAKPPWAQLDALIDDLACAMHAHDGIDSELWSTTMPSRWKTCRKEVHAALKTHLCDDDRAHRMDKLTEDPDSETHNDYFSFVDVTLDVKTGTLFRREPRHNVHATTGYPFPADLITPEEFAQDLESRGKTGKLLEVTKPAREYFEAILGGLFTLLSEQTPAANRSQADVAAEYLAKALFVGQIQTRCLVLLSPSDGGKTALFRLLKTMLGSLAVDVSVALFSKSLPPSEKSTPELRRLCSARVALLHEVGGVPVNLNTFKHVTGSDPIPSRVATQQSCNPTATIVMGGNDVFSCRNYDKALLERVAIMRMPHLFKTQQEQETLLREDPQAAKCPVGCCSSRFRTPCSGDFGEEIRRTRLGERCVLMLLAVAHLTYDRKWNRTEEMRTIVKELFPSRTVYQEGDLEAFICDKLEPQPSEDQLKQATKLCADGLGPVPPDTLRKMPYLTSLGDPTFEDVRNWIRGEEQRHKKFGVDWIAWTDVQRVLGLQSGLESKGVQEEVQAKLGGLLQGRHPPSVSRKAQTHNWYKQVRSRIRKYEKDSDGNCTQTVAVTTPSAKRVKGSDSLCLLGWRWRAKK